MEEEGGGGERQIFVLATTYFCTPTHYQPHYYSYSLPAHYNYTQKRGFLRLLLTSHPTHATLYRESVRALVPLSRPRTFHSRARVLRINGSNLRLSRASSALSV